MTRNQVIDTTDTYLRAFLYSRGCQCEYSLIIVIIQDSSLLLLCSVAILVETVFSMILFSSILRNITCFYVKITLLFLFNNYIIERNIF